VTKLPLDALQKRLGYSFNNQELLQQALTHRSASGADYERLEFLGDSILGFVIAEQLFNRFPSASEGQMTRLRSRLVKGKTIAELASQLGLSEHLILGSGELKSGGFRRESTLADAFEAILGAIYLEAGIEQVRERIIDYYGELLAGADPEQVTKDPKTRLQEYMQSRQYPLPIYETIATTGKDHQQQFEILCRCYNERNELLMEQKATASSRRKAEQMAAKLLIEQVESND
jgi:ribonuclease III